MYLKKHILIFSILITQSVFASHIIGGEITLSLKQGNLYTLRLALYYETSANPTALEEFAYISLFDKATNSLLDTIKLPKFSTLDIPTEKGICEFVNFKTSKLVYAKDIVLSAPKYAGLQGFYASYDRCCRNANILNIPNAENEGTLFYSEFPAITTVDNSAEFATPTKSIYGCVNIPQNYDFLVSDADGDLQNYSLEVPLKGSLDFRNPFGWAVAGPYSNVFLIRGISLTNIIPNQSGISINSLTGILSFTPTLAGIFAVRIKAASYRSGTYLGQVNRDYQLIISNCFAKNTKPLLQVFDLPQNKYVSTVSSINFDARKNYCLTFIGIDTVQGQILTLSATPKNVFLDDSYQLSPSKYPTKSKSDTAFFTYCLDKCIPNRSKNYDINFLLKNENNCALPSFTGLNIRLANTAKSLKPLIITTLKNKDNDTVYINSVLNFDVNALSQDSNLVKMQSISKNPIPEFNVRNLYQTNASVNYLAKCNDLIASPFIYTIYATDSNCFSQTTDSLQIKIYIVDSTFKSDFFISNIITPNNDGKNDVFEIKNLPQNNCAESFEKIDIYNRWGTKIYSQTDRNVSWNAQNSPDGLYYYILSFTTKNYKGWIQVLR
ncbi:MAG: gliding motility-associated C-terminal domain-containing protein [Bacteroidetes bacterium]|nr:MAG: gliding motility-associated C-terminal domain-containing protein [Bacteroidota bacterium]